jgi:hypothetical protein
MPRRRRERDCNFAASQIAELASVIDSQLAIRIHQLNAAVQPFIAFSAALRVH